MSGVMCHFFLLLFLTKWWSLSGEALLSTGPTPSSFLLFGHGAAVNTDEEDKHGANEQITTVLVEHTLASLGLLNIKGS